MNSQLQKFQLKLHIHKISNNFNKHIGPNGA